MASLPSERLHRLNDSHSATKRTYKHTRSEAKRNEYLPPGLLEYRNASKAPSAGIAIPNRNSVIDDVCKQCSGRCNLISFFAVEPLGQPPDSHKPRNRDGEREKKACAVDLAQHGNRSLAGSPPTAATSYNRAQA